MTTTQAEPGLRFKRVNRGRGHSYQLNGQPVPGVTTLIGAGLPKPALTNWYSRVVAEHVADNLHDEDELARWLRAGRDSLVGELAGVPSGQRDVAANRGTEVHDLARRITEGVEVEVPEPLEGHVDAYMDFLAVWQPAEELTERPVVSRRHGYAGTFDLLCTLPALGRCLIDVKTSRSGIFSETALQLAAYRRADLYEAPDGHLETMPPVEHTLALWVRADGFDLHPVVTDDDVFRSFLYIADTAKRFVWPAKEDRYRFIKPALRAPEAAA